MKKINKKVLGESLIFSKVCIAQPIAFTDPSHFKVLLGYRPTLFSLINPFLLKSSLKVGLLALESFMKNKYNIIIIANIEDSVLFNKFCRVCKNQNILLLKSSDVSLGFLTSRRTRNLVLVTLFLSPLKTEIIQKEAALISLPIITFGSLLTSKNSSLLHIGGNFDIFTVQNLILTLLTICLKKKKWVCIKYVHG
jgi:hypothetical protein